MFGVKRLTLGAWNGLEQLAGVWMSSSLAQSSTAEVRSNNESCTRLREMGTRRGPGILTGMTNDGEPHRHAARAPRWVRFTLEA